MHGGFFISIIMNKAALHIEYDVYDSSDELTPEDKQLVESARAATEKAYAPYSNFLVAAVARFANGKTASGTNQENASYPVGICAERALLSIASMEHTDIPIQSIAISYKSGNAESNRPISPCGMCRQALTEYETRMGKPFRLLLTGQSGKVFVMNSAKDLLPLSFGGSDLK
jgi:cytidine deaminase